MDSRDETPPEAEISPLFPLPIHGNRSNTCIRLKLIIRCSDIHMDAPPQKTHPQIGCLANSSYLHATVGPFTTKATLASFFHSTALVPFPFPFVELKEALLFPGAEDKYTQRKNIEAWPLWVWKICLFFNPTLCLRSMCLYLHVRVCKLSTEHKDPHHTHSHCVLCLPRPSPPARTRPLWLRSDHNYVSTHKTIKRLIKVEITSNKIPKN